MTYKFYTDNKHICKVTSTFAGAKVTGVAKCDPRDTFDKNIGFEIAKARCDYKIAKKRAKRAMNKCAEAEERYTRTDFELIKARKHRTEMYNYATDAIKAEDAAEVWLNSVIERY